MNPSDASGPAPLHLGVYSDAGELGGAEMVLGRLLRALPEHIRVTLLGVDADVLSWLAAHRADTSTMLVEPITGRFDLRGMAAHRRMFRGLTVDVLQFNLSSASSCQWAILAATSIRGVRRVALEHSPMGTWSALSARLKRLTARRLAAHLAVGDRAARIIETSSGLPTGSIQVIHHGITEPERIAADRPDGPTLLAVSRFDPVKGLDVLVDAMALTAAATRLVIVGSGPEGPALRRQIAARDLGDRIEIREPAKGEMNAASMMWAFDGFVLPSRLEGFPVTIVEAMFAGLPVVATDVGSVREQVVPGTTGWVVPPEDPAALAAAMDELTDDLDAARALGAAGREVATDSFTIDATVDAYLQLYRRLLDT